MYSTGEIFNNPLISVILRTCDRPLYLREALRSVEQQAVNNIEVLLIDTGVNECDKTGLRNFAKPLVYIRKIKASAGAALNIGVANSKGEYIAFLDDDDWWDKDFLYVMYNAITNDSSDIVACNAYYVIEDREIRKRIPEKCKKDIFVNMIKDDFMVTDGLLIRNMALKEMGPFDESLSTNMDWDMLLKMLLSKKQVSFIDDYLTYVRIHKQNISIDKIRSAINQYRVLKKIERSDDRLNDSERKALEHSIARRKIFLGVSLIEDNKKREGRK